MSTHHRIDPRIRALGKARVDVIRRARDEQEFQKLWHEARHPFPFSWGQGWKYSLEYFVDDYPAEVGFFIDILGFPVNTFSPSYAQFTSPEQDFFFTVAATPDGGLATPAESLRLQFQLANLSEAVKELELRGVVCEIIHSDGAEATPYASFRTPNGILVELLGQASVVLEDELQEEEIDKDDGDGDITPLDSFWAEDEWEDDDSKDLSEEALDEEHEAVITPAFPGVMVERSLPVIEITYEDIGEKEDSDFEDEQEEPLPVKREPIPSLAARGRTPRSAPRTGLPPTDIRPLDIPLEPGALIRNRRKRHDGAVIFPLRENRDQRRDD